MVICLLAAVLCLIYYVMIIVDSGVTATFSQFWLVMSAALAAVSAFWHRMRKKHVKLPKWLLIFIGTILLIGLIIFICVEFLLISAAAERAEDGGDYVIVLGAQVRGDVPSRVLRRRVERAAEYLKKNPQAKVIASGGQGSGENITEAQCIKNVLLELGIEEARILTEDTSADTYENIRNSLKLCGTDKKIVIVTCSYHVYRAQQLAKAAGVQNVYGLASANDPVLLLNYYVREFFAVIKYKLGGQI